LFTPKIELLSQLRSTHFFISCGNELRAADPADNQWFELMVQN